MRAGAYVVMAGIVSVALAGTAYFHEATSARAASPAASLVLPGYAPQKVVYHLTTKGGWFDRDYVRLLGSVDNHIRAVGQDRIDLRVVLQGDGVDLLADAAGNATLARQVATLRGKGVRFLVCRNTLVSKGLDPARDLYEVRTSDIVGAGVAEVAALEAQGFVYLHP